MSKFNPQTDIPSLRGKVYLITGANSGIGEATVTALAHHNPEKLYLAARSRSKAEAALSRIRAVSAQTKSANIEILDLDLASFKSIKAAAARVNNEVDRLDVLQLNGGVAMVPHNTTEDGYELQFGTNYLGHALLTKLLMPKLLATTALPSADVRVISVTSAAQKVFAPKAGILFPELRSDMKEYGGQVLYGQAMLAKALFAHELAARYPQITSPSLHPGTVKSTIYGGDKSINWFLQNLFLRPLVSLVGITVEEGAKLQLWCSFGKDVKSGSYYEKIGKVDNSGDPARFEGLGARLWEWTEKEFQKHDASVEELVARY